MMFVEGSGMVVSMHVMYRKERNSVVDRYKPLTRAEVLKYEVCTRCGRDPRCVQRGTKMFLTADTLALMQKWTEEKVRREVQQREEWEKREADRLREERDRGFVVQTFSQLMPEGPKEKAPKKGRQYKGEPKPKRNPDAPKNFGDARPAQASKPLSKKKQKEAEKSAKKKGR
jgi:hypothetical protein